MFWRHRGQVLDEQLDDEGFVALSEPIEVERDAPRPAAILRIVGEFERRGKDVVDLFEEVESPYGRAVLPIHLRDEEGDLFIEVLTVPWDDSSFEDALRAAAVLRNSKYAGARLELLSAYPAPEEMAFFFSRSPGALLQLDLLQEVREDKEPETLAEAFRKTAARHWGVDLDYDTRCLPLVEELLTVLLRKDEKLAPKSPVLDVFAEGLGCYLGEIIRNNAREDCSWDMEQGSEGNWTIGFQKHSADPISEARAFLDKGTGRSLSSYVDYELAELCSNRNYS